MASKRFVRFSQHALWLVAAATLGYVGFVLTESALFQSRASRLLDRARDAAASSSHAATSNTPRSRFSGPLSLAGRTVIGRLEIPGIHFSAMILEGVDSQSLHLGVGHIPGTAWPGEPGNVGIAGHRDTFFHPLRKIARNDRIRLTALGGSWEYVVDSVRVVSPDDIRVLAPTGAHSLTLVTCYPFQWAGPAPRRFIVHAQLVR